MSRTAADAIARSVSHNEIVTLDYDSTLAADLLEESEDCVHDAGRELTEYWGTTEDGDEWRVHLRDGDPEAEGDVLRARARDE